MSSKNWMSGDGTHIYVTKNRAGAYKATETTTDHAKWICDRGTYATLNALADAVRGWERQGRKLTVSLPKADLNELRRLFFSDAAR